MPWTLAFSYWTISLASLNAKIRWTMSVHLFCLQNYILGTSTSMVPLPFFSWCKPKLSRDNFNSQSTALQSSGPTSWSRHSVNRPLLIARFWRSTEVKLIKCSIPKGEVPSVGLIIITSMAFHIVQRQIQTHQPNQQKEHPLLYDFNKSIHECNMSTDHIQFTVGGWGMAATVRYQVAIKWSQKEQQISSEYVKWVPARHSVGRMYLKPCEAASEPKEVE
jgi:hypothetical protein